MTAEHEPRRILVVSIGLACLIGAALLAAFLALGADAPKNVILISVDALNRSALQAYDSRAPRLPAFERLAARSAVFDRAYSTASWTLPAHASLFSGCYPDRHGAITGVDRVSDKVPMLVERFRKAGYLTAGFTDEGYVSRSFGFDRGFELYDDFARSDELREAIVLPRGGLRNDIAGEDPFDRGLAFIESVRKRARERGDGGQPFFLFLHTYSVHDYFREHPWAVASMRDPKDRPPRGYLACLTGRTRCSRKYWEQLQDLYRAELHHVDEGLGRLLDLLVRSDLLAETHVVLLADHGEGFDHRANRIHHGGRLHADLIRIPLMISGPGVRPGRIDVPVSLVDVLPTLLDLHDLAAPDYEIDGRPVAVSESDDRGASRPLFAFEHGYYWKHGKRRVRTEDQSKNPAVAVILGDNWYIRSVFGEELYNDVADPEQRRNLVDVEPGGRELMGELVRQRREYRPARAKALLGASLASQLRALGYLDDGSEEDGGEPEDAGVQR